MSVEVFIAGLVLGALAAAAWLAPRLARAGAERDAERVAHEARLQDLTVGQRRLIEEVKAELPRLADDVLGKQADRLKETARGEFALVEAQTVTKVSEAQAPLTAAVAEMRRQLSDYSQRVAALDGQIASVAQAGKEMVGEARTLKQALRGGSQVRGSWAEENLANVLARCGMVEGTDFARRVPVAGGGEIDFVIEIPPAARLVVDCKSPDFVAWSEAEDEAARGARAAAFAESLTAMGRDLARRGYTEKLAGAVPCVVMYVPSEAAFRAALDAQPTLFLELLERNIVLATETTAYPMIRLLSAALPDYRAQHNVAAIVAECRELGGRLEKFAAHLAAIGKALEDAGSAYKDALGSYDRRLAPQVRKVRALDAGFADDGLAAGAESH